MTPFELNLLLETYVEKEEKKTEYMITMAWLTANYTRADKLPSLEEVLGKKKQKEPQSAEQMFAMVKLMNAALGGD